MFRTRTAPAPGAEGLDDVIIGAEGETFDAVRFLAARGEHERAPVCGSGRLNGHILCLLQKSLKSFMMARPSHARCKLTLVVALAAFYPVGAGSAQQPATDSSSHCDGKLVYAVDVKTDRPSFKGAMVWWRRIARKLGLHHETTSEGLVRRFVTLDPGRGCTEFRRTESERILRAQPYLAEANIVATQTGDSVLVGVSTVDEVPVIAGARLRGSHVEAFNLGTMNLLGAGMHVEGRWQDGRVYRDGFGGRLSHNQIFGRPYSIAFEGDRYPIGEAYSTALSHPFITDLQRIAWHAGFTTSKDFARLRRPDRAQLVMPLDRSIWDVGGVVRLGPPRRLYLIGGVVLGQHFMPGNELSQVDTITGRFTPIAPPPPVGVRQYDRYDATSVAAVLGVRALTFTRMRLDAIESEQDVATGTQVGTLIGTAPLSGSFLGNGFTAIDAYAGGRSRRNFVGARAEIESRVDLQRRDWEHLIASGRAAWYFKPTRRWTSEVSIEGGAGWRTLLPFQLDLGDRNGGVRGYARSLEAGAQRLLVRGEQRFDLARYQKTRAAIGAAFFADAGKIWAGDVPFGVTTPARTSVGAALLAAIPARSQRTIRAEVALPLDRTLGARPELRFVVREPARGFWFDPPRVRWARLSTVPEQIFSWP